jgi:LuxR family maltose regulon positive regulatory protein
MLKDRCTRRHLAELVLQIDILQSAILYAMHQQARGALLLKEALAFSETEGYIRPFVDDAKLIAPILKRIAGELPRSRRTPHLEKIFAACGISRHETAVPRSCGPGRHEALTRREIEILGWMAQGFQNKEIAQRACIAITTVKSHVSNILVKLDVKTRTQAILKSGEIELLKIK